MRKWQLALAMFALGGLLLTLWTMWLDGTLLPNLPMLFWLFVSLASVCLFGGFALYLIGMAVKASTGVFWHGPWLVAASLVTLMTIWDVLIVTDVWIGSSIRSISLVAAFMPRGNLLDGGPIEMTFVLLITLLVVALAGVAVYRHTKRWYEGFSSPKHATPGDDHAEGARAERTTHEDRASSTHSETHRVDAE